MSAIKDSLDEVRRRIAAAALKSGRTPEAVRLIAVSKKKPVEAIQSLLELGQLDFAENQIQEALGKLTHFQDREINWHFIGHLQSNKCRFIPGYFNWVHSIDSDKLARRIAQAASESGHTVNLLLQVNVANDPAKHGVKSRDLFPLIDSILELQSDRIPLRGLMTVGFRTEDDQQTRRMFADLRQLLEQCQRRFGASLTELSMGMSKDYELAIEEGATQVRLGTTLFGDRV